VDELWVPSQFNVDTFTSAGVDAAKIKIVPEPVDVFSYSAEMYSGNDTPLDNTFTFLTVMTWEERKAWRELLTAYAEEFAAGEEVELVIRSSLEEDNWSELDELLEELKQDRSTELPQITVLEEAVPFWKMSSLYAMADAFVLASHGEGWGLPLIQAMSMGLPTIGTNWSGNTEFMDADNALLVDVGELVEVEGRAGHRWALPAHNSLRSQLRAAFSMSPGRREELGQKVRTSPF
jgi:glycosyltransferase involved in cell wall biosynthesis